MTTTTTTLDAQISALFRAKYTEYLAREREAGTDENEAMALAVEDARNDAAAEVPAGIHGTFDDERLTFTADAEGRTKQLAQLTAREADAAAASLEALSV